MKRIIIVTVCLLLLLTSCANSIGPEETTSSSKESTTEKNEIPSESESTEKTTEKETEEITEEYTQRPYPDIIDIDPDLETVDYSKFVFIDGVSFPINDLSANAPINEVQACVADMANSIKDYNGERFTVSDHEDAVTFLEQFVTREGFEGYSLMVLVCYDTVGSTNNSGLYYVDTMYSEVFEYKHSIAKYGVEEPMDVIMFIQKELDLFNTPEFLMKAIEKYTRYSKVTQIIICSAAE